MLSSLILGFQKFYKKMMKKPKQYVELLNIWPHKSLENWDMELKLIGGVLDVLFLKW